MENQTVVSTMFWPWIAGNLSVVSIPLSHGKSNRCFNNVLASSSKAIYPSFQFLSQMQNLTVFSTIYWPLIAGPLSVVLILLSNVKSHRYFNAFFAFYCRQSILFF